MDLAKLEELHRLQQSGALTEAEYQRLKGELLANPSDPALSEVGGTQASTGRSVRESRSRKAAVASLTALGSLALVAASAAYWSMSKGGPRPSPETARSVATGSISRAVPRGTTSSSLHDQSKAASETPATAKRNPAHTSPDFDVSTLEGVSSDDVLSDPRVLAAVPTLTQQRDLASRIKCQLGEMPSPVEIVDGRYLVGSGNAPPSCRDDGEGAWYVLDVQTGGAVLGIDRYNPSTKDKTPVTLFSTPAADKWYKAWLRAP